MTKLITFGNRIINLCKKNNIELILYGSLLLKYYTKDKSIKINDIDFYIKETDFKKIITMLSKENIKFEYSKEWHTLQILENNLKIELDSIDFWYDGPKDFNEFDFEKQKIKALSLDGLKHIYKKASEVSDKKEQNKEKYAKLVKITSKLNLIKIQKIIEKSWSKETAYYDYLWKKNNHSKSSGQCRITALLVQELLGGEILYTYVKGNSQFDHYYNKIDNLELDLTSKQFKKETEFVKPKKLTRKQVIGKDKRTIETYKILKQNFMENLK